MSKMINDHVTSNNIEWYHIEITVKVILEGIQNSTL